MLLKNRTVLESTSRIPWFCLIHRILLLSATGCLKINLLVNGGVICLRRYCNRIPCFPTIIRSSVQQKLDVLRFPTSLPISKNSDFHIKYYGLRTGRKKSELE
ncbi:hypothetical protein NPIL_168431 [Nephila pilipes]|uniref:Uncharacterized protein n=1 Tax=Nephila pilipes TaxID=299642 RepID=A0A8X6P5E0_NEPPI|nr:hypothetical protein NPIL_168431 [Nephila pilipes]